MIIENSLPPDDLKGGRPTIYPFIDLNPNQRLIIPGKDDLPAHRLSVQNAFNIFKKKNNFDWTATVRIEGENIVIYRIS